MTTHIIITLLRDYVAIQNDVTRVMVQTHSHICISLFTYFNEFTKIVYGNIFLLFELLCVI